MTVTFTKLFIILGQLEGTSARILSCLKEIRANHSQEYLALAKTHFGMQKNHSMLAFTCNAKPWFV